MRIIVGLALILMPAMSTADQIMVRSGMFCNTELEVQTLLTHMDIHEGNVPREAIPANCGMFLPETPVPMTVEHLYWYETPSMKTLVTTFTHEPSGWVQYGWSAFVPMVPDQDT